MLTVIENEDAIEIMSRMPPGQRVVFGLLALFPWIAPYELLIQRGWQSYFNFFFLFALIISLGAIAVSLFLVVFAAAGLNSRLQFDRRRGIISYSAGAPVVRWRTVEYPLADLAKLHLEKIDWSDGSPSYSVLAALKDGRELKSGSSWSKAEIEAIVQRVSSFLAA
jgi:hypothetical protein